MLVSNKVGIIEHPSKTVIQFQD